MLSVIGIITIFLIAGIFIVSWFKINPTLGTILAVSFALRAIVVLLQELFQIAPYTWDEGLFMTMGIKVKHFLDGSRSSLPFRTLAGVPAYGSLLGGLFYLYEVDTILPRILNVLFGTGAVFLTWKLSALVGLKNKYCLLMATIVGFTPSYILYSALIMRDMLIWLLLLVLLYLWVKFIQDLDSKSFWIA